MVKVLRKHGFVKVDQEGSHMKFVHTSGRVVIIPRHDILDVGTLKAILEQAGISREQFLNGL